MSVRKRDNYICQRCGKNEEEELANSNRVLAVHHVNNVHEDNRLENAITLCGACHTTVTKEIEVAKSDQRLYEILDEIDKVIP